MSSLTTSRLTNEQLIYANPIELEPDRHYGRNIDRYTILLGSRRLPIGGLGVIFDDDHKVLHWPAIIPELRGKGFGVATYVAASRIPDASGVVLPLFSDAPDVSQSAERFWQSLAARGMARAIDPEVCFYALFNAT